MGSNWSWRTHCARGHIRNARILVSCPQSQISSRWHARYGNADNDRSRTQKEHDLTWSYYDLNRCLRLLILLQTGLTGPLVPSRQAFLRLSDRYRRNVAQRGRSAALSGAGPKQLVGVRDYRGSAQAILERQRRGMSAVGWPPSNPFARGCLDTAARSRPGYCRRNGLVSGAS
jgi:hypothetical protein